MQDLIDVPINEVQEPRRVTNISDSIRRGVFVLFYLAYTIFFTFAGLWCFISEDSDCGLQAGILYLILGIGAIIGGLSYVRMTHVS